MEILLEAIRPDTSLGETPEVPRYEASRGPGSTAEVDFWTSREPREVVRSHVNYLVPDTSKWEQSAGYFIDAHSAVDAFVKNAGLGFAIPYLHNGQMHEYVPDIIIRLKTTPPSHLILEAKGFDPLENVKRAAAGEMLRLLKPGRRLYNGRQAHTCQCFFGMRASTGVECGRGHAQALLRPRVAYTPTRTVGPCAPPPLTATPWRPKMLQ